VEESLTDGDLYEKGEGGTERKDLRSTHAAILAKTATAEVNTSTGGGIIRKRKR